jgi:hypothetical protein
MAYDKLLMMRVKPLQILEPSEWMELLDPEGAPLTRCCSNVAALRKQIASLLRHQDQEILRISAKVVLSVYAQTRDNHTLEHPSLIKLMQALAPIAELELAELTHAPGFSETLIYTKDIEEAIPCLEVLSAEEWFSLLNADDEQETAEQTPSALPICCAVISELRDAIFDQLLDGKVNQSNSRAFIRAFVTALEAHELSELDNDPLKKLRNVCEQQAGITVAALRS